MIEIINSQKTVKARKPHVCDLCGCEIYVGEKYSAAVYKYDGSIYACRTHFKCSVLVSKLNMEGDEGVTGEIFHEYITEEYNKLVEIEDFEIHNFKYRVAFVYKYRCEGN